MKKLAIIIPIIVLLGILIACYKSAEKDSNLTRNLVLDWSNYLQARQDMYENMKWAFSYIESFEQNHTWNNLQLAQMALDTAYQAIDSRELP